LVCEIFFFVVEFGSIVTVAAVEVVVEVVVVAVGSAGE
jgi:hypothetical protein